MDADIEIRKEIEGKNISYIHFDRRIKLTNHLWRCITNKKWVLRHGFYPFIHFKRPKYHKSWSTDSSGKRIWKDEGPKYRDILYAAHKDAWIYRYYGALFNRQYNQYLGNKGTDDLMIVLLHIGQIRRENRIFHLQRKRWPLLSSISLVMLS